MNIQSQVQQKIIPYENKPQPAKEKTIKPKLIPKIKKKTDNQIPKNKITNTKKTKNNLQVEENNKQQILNPQSNQKSENHQNIEKENEQKQQWDQIIHLIQNFIPKFKDIDLEKNPEVKSFIQQNTQHFLDTLKEQIQDQKDNLNDPIKIEQIPSKKQFEQVNHYQIIKENETEPKKSLQIIEKQENAETTNIQEKAKINLQTKSGETDTKNKNQQKKKVKEEKEKEQIPVKRNDLNKIEQQKIELNVQELKTNPNIFDKKTIEFENNLKQYEELIEKRLQRISQRELKLRKEEELIKNLEKNLHDFNLDGSLKKLFSYTTLETEQSEKDEIMLNLVTKKNSVWLEKNKNEFTEHDFNNLISMVFEKIVEETVQEIKKFSGVQNVLKQITNFEEQENFNQNLMLSGLECQTLNFIKDFLVAFSEFVKDNFSQEFLESINEVDLLHSQNQLKQFKHRFKPSYQLEQNNVIGKEIFSKFMDYFQNVLCKDDLPEGLGELELIQLNMIFNSFNQSLNFMRPYGILGKPNFWETSQVRLYKKVDQENIEKVLGLSIARVLKWASFLCGFIPEKIESPNGEQLEIDEDYLEQIKEERLSCMLENEIIENENDWLVYDKEKAIILFELSDQIFEELVQEFVNESLKKQKDNQNKTNLLPKLYQNQHISRFQNSKIASQKLKTNNFLNAESKILINQTNGHSKQKNGQQIQMLL
ncbi:hypothetical protein PPERSA_02207 [Pseudocohnilembus persalinus]|uniref:Uncharacterized protein n=1 Tax=Pseudocohnilembus persalinus TaxID=266149 RepID=A0A0V0Q884_PSEPJ|nr:hypothetical protein PPERSA_02207 [Pseudocohnilembus persalinus]|eukprot:KRW98263.1 hypothetical protein PPERSA_02207 [Pseudocohnilembus persalinus]